MSINRIRVAILIVNHSGKHYLETCLSSLFRCSYKTIEHYIYVVDTGSTDGSVEYIRRRWKDVRLLALPDNRGFAGGNNAGWRQIKDDHPDCDYVFLLNADTIVSRNFLEPLVAHMERNARCGSAQPLLLLYPESSKINSLGNVIHYLGFGYSSYCGVRRDKAPVGSHRINYSSGAACMLRTRALEETDLFEDFMFMYLEDLDLGWRMLLAGWTNELVPESVVYHQYDFHRGLRQYYYFERNRLYILLKNYKVATLLCVAPMWLFMEFGQLVYAVIHGRLAEKLRSYGYFFRARNIKYLREQRRFTQGLRRCRDGAILRQLSGRIDFQPIDSVMMRRIANPVVNAYFFVIKRLVVW